MRLKNQENRNLELFYDFNLTFLNFQFTFQREPYKIQKYSEGETNLCPKNVLNEI
jgi:hypothetical protein